MCLGSSIWQPTSGNTQKQSKKCVAVVCKEEVRIYHLPVNSYKTCLARIKLHQWETIGGASQQQGAICACDAASNEPWNQEALNKTYCFKNG